MSFADPLSVVPLEVGVFMCAWVNAQLTSQRDILHGYVSIL